MSRYGIDNEVWETIFEGLAVTPGRLVLAASLCPAVLGELTEQSEPDEWGLISWNAYDSLRLAEESIVTAECHGSDGSVVIRNALSSWVMTRASTTNTIEMLAEWDRNLAAWCACSVAETTLKCAGPSRRTAALAAINTVRKYVRGEATLADVRSSDDAIGRVTYAIEAENAEARNVSLSAGYYALISVGATVSICHSSRPSGSAVRAVTAAAESTAYATTKNGLAWEMATVDEIKRLREVIAGAIHTYPRRESFVSSRGLVGGRTLAAGIAGVAAGAVAMHLARRS